MTLPINRAQAHKMAQWMKAHFGDAMDAATEGTPFSTDLLCAIACQETAYVIVGWIGTYGADVILARSVFDASGDAEGTERTAFPVNAAAFRARYGDEFTDMLIAEANLMRPMRHPPLAPAHLLYKGYGIFQYDLQHVTHDEAFFREKQWATFATCLDRVLTELTAKYSAQKNDLREAVRAYNGRGAKAEAYRDNVFTFLDYCREVDKDGPI
jgi:hypothetical protein